MIFGQSTSASSDLPNQKVHILHQTCLCTRRGNHRPFFRHVFFFHRAVWSSHSALFVTSFHWRGRFLPSHLSQVPDTVSLRWPWTPWWQEFWVQERRCQQQSKSISLNPYQSQPLPCLSYRPARHHCYIWQTEKVSHLTFILTNPIRQMVWFPCRHMAFLCQVCMFSTYLHD